MGRRHGSTRGSFLLILIVLVSLGSTTFAEHIECKAGERLDVVSYDWKLKGFLSWIAGLKFPTKGTGTLATLYKVDGTADTELRIITNEDDGDLYGYRSVIDLEKERTMVSMDGFKFEGRTKNDTTTFDYETGKARRVRSDTDKGAEETVRFTDFDSENVKDVLTAIHHISQTAEEINRPQRAEVFAGGKLYEVLITPGTTKSLEFDGKKVESKLFTITATPENKKKWPGDVKVWITSDDARLPIRIDLGKSMASLKLEAVARYSCP